MIRLTVPMLFLLLFGLCSVVTPTRADDDGGAPPLFVPQLLNAQATLVGQKLDHLRSPYAGPLSLPANGDQAVSRTFGVYLGMRLPAHLAFYLDTELFTGGGVNKGTGTAGYVNGDVVRAGPGSGSKQRPYIARAYLDWNWPLGEDSAPVGRAQDQLPGAIATQRIELKLGRLALADDFDKNRYANDTRHQFMNWDFINAAAYDYAADTRGYTDGFVAAWVQPRWTLRYGLYQMPLLANGQALAGPLGRARAEQVQLSLRPFGSDGFALRLLAFRNIAKMGSYAQALAMAASGGTPPDIVANDRYGRRKHGYVINAELPLADAGDTGLFARWAWNDGHTQSFAYTEADRALSVGAQLSGVHWRRSEDRVGVAFDFNGLGSAHRAYLAAGGCGFLLCDGALDYGRERVVEAYYRLQLGHYLQLSPDLQWITNPGYNRARGPARVVGLRMHLSL
jgi:Carbohydrate-selective porin